MSGEARVWLGGLLSAIGAIGWSLSLFVFGPEADLTYRTLEAQPRPEGWSAPNWDELAQMVLWGKDLRWAAIVLALGGMLLLVAGRARLYVFAGVLGWFGADLYLDRIGASGWVAAMMATAGLAVVIGGTALTAGSRTRREPGNGGHPVIIFYSSVACAFVPLLFWADPSIKLYRPQGMLVMAAVLSVSLVMAAIAGAATATQGTGRRGAVTGAVFTGVVAAGMIAAEVASASLGGDGDRTMILRLVPMAGIPILVAGVLIVLNGRPTVAGWFAYALFAIVAGAATGIALVVGISTSYQLQPDFTLLMGDKPFFDAFLLSPAGLSGGIAAGVGAWIVVSVRRGAKSARERQASPYSVTIPADGALI